MSISAYFRDRACDKSDPIGFASSIRLLMPTSLTSFGHGINAVVVGANGGIGSAFVDALVADPRVARVNACSRSYTDQPDEIRRSHKVDFENESTIIDAAKESARMGPVDLLIVATGILHDGDRLLPEKTWRSIDSEAMVEIFRINTIGPALVAKHFMPHLARDRKSVFAALSARVGSITDNSLGGWHAYRASKSALNMLIKNFAIEIGRSNKRAICVGLHPGTVATPLSAPYRSSVAKSKLFSPSLAVGRMLSVVDELRTADSGKTFAWDGSEIPF